MLEKRTFKMDKGDYVVGITVLNAYNPKEHYYLTEGTKRKVIFDIAINGVFFAIANNVISKEAITRKKEDNGKSLISYRVSKNDLYPSLPKVFTDKIKKFVGKEIYFELEDDAKAYIEELYKKNEEALEEYKELFNVEFESLADIEALTIIDQTPYVFGCDLLRETKYFEEFKDLYKGNFIKKDELKEASFDFEPTWDDTKYHIQKGEFLKLLDIGRSALQKKLEEEKRKDEEEDKRIKALIEKAKTEGPQLIYQRVVDCNDPEEDCDIDYIYTYIDKDGKRTEKRQHTW